MSKHLSQKGKDATRNEHAPSSDSLTIVSKDGCFIYKYETQYWTCPMSKAERKLVKAILASDETCYSEHEEFKSLSLKDLKKKSIGKIKKSVRTLCSAMKERDFPIRVSLCEVCDEKYETVQFRLHASHPYLQQFCEADRRFFY